MKINVKDPKSGKLLGLEVKPAQNNKEQGWSITLPAGNDVFITYHKNQWKVRHNDMVSNDLIEAIGSQLN